MKVLSIAIMTAIYLMLPLACSKKSSSSSTTTTQETTPAGTLATNTSFNAGVPSKVAVSSVTAPRTSATSAGTIIAGLTSTSDTDHVSKLERMAAVIEADEISECSGAIPSEFNLAQGNLGHARCFGNQVAYTSHPDLSGGDADGSFGSGDLGMMFAYESPTATSGQACSSTVMNNLMNNVGSYTDAALGIHAMIACAAKIDTSIDLPASGETTDVSAALSGIDLSSLNLAITAATFSYVGNSDAGYPIYSSNVTGTLTDVARSLTKNFTLYVKHQNDNTDNTAYTGNIQFKIDEFEGENNLALSLKYNLADDTLKYRYHQRQFPSSETTVFDSTTLEVTLASTETFAGTEVIANVDANGFGTLSFAWNTFDILVFNAKTQNDGTGYAFFGHSSSEDSAGNTNYRTIQGLRCLALNPVPSGIDKYSSYVQRQTLTFNSSSGAWEPSESDITFAPTGSCSWNSDNDSSQTATFTITVEDEQGGESTQSMSYPRTADLYSVSTYQTTWTAPSVP